MSTENLSLAPQPNDGTNHLLKKILNALNLGLLSASPQTAQNIQVVNNRTIDYQVTLNSTTPAGTSPVIGNVGGYSVGWFLQVGSGAGAYADGDSIGVPSIGQIVREGQTTCILNTLTLMDSSNVGPACRVMIGGGASIGGFWSNTVTDNQPFVWGTGPLALQNVIDIASTDWVTLGGRKVISKRQLGIVIDTTNYNRYVGLAIVANGIWTSTVSQGFLATLGFLLD